MSDNHLVESANSDQLPPTTHARSRSAGPAAHRASRLANRRPTLFRTLDNGCGVRQTTSPEHLIFDVPSAQCPVPSALRPAAGDEHAGVQPGVLSRAGFEPNRQPHVLIAPVRRLVGLGGLRKPLGLLDQPGVVHEQRLPLSPVRNCARTSGRQNPSSLTPIQSMPVVANAALIWGHPEHINVISAACDASAIAGPCVGISTIPPTSAN